MGSSMSILIRPFSRIQWVCNANADPSSPSQEKEWKRFSDVENMIIEEAFQAGRSHVDLDNCSIDFKDGTAILNTEDNTEYSVNYFPIHPKQPFGGLYGWISPFIREVAKDLNMTPDHLPSKDKRIVPMIVAKAALGIIEEGKILRKQCEAEKMANLLMEVKDAGMKAVWMRCAHLYTWDGIIHTVTQLPREKRCSIEELS